MNILLFAFVFLLTVFIRIFNVEINFLGIGALSTFSTLFFNIWVIFSSLGQSNQSSSSEIPAFGAGYIEMIGSLILAFDIHGYINQVLLDGADPEKY